MSRYEVSDWGGTAVVLGCKRRFLYLAGSGRLAVYGLTEHEAKTVLGLFTLESVAQEESPGLSGWESVSPHPHPERVEKESKEQPQKQEWLKIEDSPEPAEPPTLAEANTEPPVYATAEPEKPKKRRGRPKKLEIPPVEMKPVVVAEAPTPEAPEQNSWALTPPGEDPEKPPPSHTLREKSKYDLDTMRDKTKLRDILGHLIDCGYDSPEAMVDACVELRDEVPYLSTIADLAKRVPRALEIMGWPDLMD